MLAKSPATPPGWLANRVAQSLLFKQESARLRRQIQVKVEANPELVTRVYEAREKVILAQQVLDMALDELSDQPCPQFNA